MQKVVRSRNPSAKVLISLGGWADSAGDKYSKMVNNPDLRASFVDNTVEFLRDDIIANLISFIILFPWIEPVMYILPVSPYVPRLIP